MAEAAVTSAAGGLNAMQNLSDVMNRVKSSSDQTGQVIKANTPVCIVFR